ncbi:uncharacterized protein EAE97_002276 [Botrytis byssoidea]|uniref:Uncharacterized protein n=1 Tax=Botrytis byssoidea TaxID=139641 RepID=A0A9P5IV54_9HELO|nr:uncharacterized protein EAE97_002276 [Botrytis byssoidea]KAF7950724.1 hypothetical protein EAE97_002276 [Botrytis byssoidea]
MILLLLESKDLRGRSEGVPNICIIFQKDLYATNHEAVGAQSAILRAWFYVIEAQHIALVTRGGFLQYLTEDGTVSDPKKGTLKYIYFLLGQSSNNKWVLGKKILKSKNSRLQKTRQQKGPRLLK